MFYFIIKVFIYFMSQEEKDICEKINLYYDIAEKLRFDILQLTDITEIERFDILMPIVAKIQNLADILTVKYVKFLNNEIDKNEIIELLDDFLEYVSVYKTKIYELYNK